MVCVQEGHGPAPAPRRGDRGREGHGLATVSDVLELPSIVVVPAALHT